MIEIWKKFIKSQYEHWFPETIIQQPEKKGEIKYKEIYDLVLKECRVKPYLSDSIYSLTTKTEAIKYSNESKYRYKQWKKEKYDCDEFSFALMGFWNKGLHQFAFGVAWTKRHAFNIMVDSKRHIWIIEPQSNIFMRLDSIKKNINYWPLKLVII